jgi:hypothetical protein
MKITQYRRSHYQQMMEVTPDFSDVYRIFTHAFCPISITFIPIFNLHLWFLSLSYEL